MVDFFKGMKSFFFWGGPGRMNMYSIRSKVKQILGVFQDVISFFSLFRFWGGISEIKHHVMNSRLLLHLIIPFLFFWKRG